MFSLDFHISDKQAREIAKAIFADIDSYVESHKDEFEEFLEQEESEVRNVEIKIEH